MSVRSAESVSIINREEQAMFIHEAVKEAISKNATIRREHWRPCGIEHLLTEPIAIYKKSKELRFWNPTPKDLMADDWEVVE